MAQAQNLAQHRTIMGIPPGGALHSSSMVASQSDSPIASFANVLGDADYRNSPIIQQLAQSSSRWQVAATSADLHVPTRWPNNSVESSGHCRPSLDTFNAAYSELFDNPMRGADMQQQQQQQQFMDGSGRYAAPVPSVLSGLSTGLERLLLTLPSPLQSALGPTSPQMCETSWTPSVDHSNLGLTVDPSKGGLSLQGAGHPNTQSLPRFSANPGFAERAARFSAFGSGQFSPSFPLTENGNVGSSPYFENDSGKRAKVSVGAARPATCLTDVPKNSLPHNSTSEGRGAERGREDKNTKGEARASGSKSVTASASAHVDHDTAEKGRIADEADRALADSDASDESRGQQEASCSDQAAGHLVRTTSTGKKRKTSCADEAVKEAACLSSKEHKGSGGQSKRSKDGDRAPDKEEQRAKSEWSGSENSGLTNSPASKECSKEKEQPKLDYIHVRARRGQATDSHSLAERVRREKISERMKYLQDLVPGCSKVTGKAVMLDEIINYVQSIQRQVEFLSMKLAAVTPRPDSIDNILNKQMNVGHSFSHPNMVEHTNNSPSFGHIQPQRPVHMPYGVTHNVDFIQPAADMNIRRVNGNQVPFHRTPVETFDVGQAQTSNQWDGDLQSVVQMGFGHGMQGFGLSGLQCDMPPGHMKMEL